MDGRSIEPPEAVIPRMIKARGRRWSFRSPFTRVATVPPVGTLSREVRAALDGIDPLIFGHSAVWGVTAETDAGTVSRTMLELWEPVPGPIHPSHRLTPMIDPGAVVAIAPSPHLPPAWVAEAAWDLPIHHDMRQVRFITSDGTEWIGSWTAFPVFFPIPEGIEWSDVADVQPADAAGPLRSELPQRDQPVHCPFVVADDDPLWNVPTTGRREEPTDP